MIVPIKPEQMCVLPVPTAKTDAACFWMTATATLVYSYCRYRVFIVITFIIQFCPPIKCCINLSSKISITRRDKPQ